MTNANSLLEVVAESISTKQRAKPRVPWETLVVRKQRADVTIAFLCNGRNPTNINVQKVKTAQNQLTNVYQKEQTEYIQDPINKIRAFVKDIKCRIAWKKVVEVSKKEDCCES